MRRPAPLYSILIPPRRRWGRRHGNKIQCHLGGVLLSVVEVLTVVPEPSLVDRAVDGHTARPGCAATYILEFGKHLSSVILSLGASMVMSGAFGLGRLTSSV